MKNVRVGNFFGGLPIKQQREQLKDKDKCPHIIVGTPGRVKAVRALLGSSGVAAALVVLLPTLIAAEAASG